MTRLPASLCLVTTALTVATAAPLAAPRWLRLDTPNFVIIGDAGEGRLQSAAEDLERFREALSRGLREGATSEAVPTIVIVFAKDKEFAPFSPVYRGKAVKVGGLTVSTSDINYIALSAEGDAEARLQTIRHEYAHVLIANASPGLPLWLNEGLADLYSTFTLRRGGRAALLGRVKVPYLQLMKQSVPFAMTELLKVTPDSPLYNEDERTSLFYAQSWALVHMLLMGEAERGSLLTGFVGAVGGGVTPQDAWHRLAGKEQTIEGALREYVNRERFNAFEFRFVTPVAATRPAAVPLVESDVDAFLGDYLARQERFDEAIARLERTPARTRTRLAAAALTMARANQGRPSQESPTTTRSNDWLTEYLVAAATLSVARASSDNSLDPTEARAGLEFVRRERPALANAWKMQAVALLYQNRDVEARDAIERARELAPGRDDYALVHADALARLGEFDLARSVLGPLLASRSPQVRDHARQQMKYILAIAALPPGLRDEAVRSGRVPVLRQLEPGERREEGFLDQIECHADGVSAHVRLADRVARFHAPRLEDVRLITHREDLTGASVTCGERTPPDRVLVTWTEGLPAAAGADGVLVALELLRPGGSAQVR